MKKTKNKNCLNCGEELTGRQEKYCSSKCNNKKYREDNRNILLRRKKEKYKSNIDQTKKYYRDNKKRIDKYYRDNKENIKKRVGERYKENREKILVYAKSYGEKNRKKIGRYWKEWGIKNKKELNKWQREYQKEKRKDLLYRLGGNISSGIRSCLKSKNLRKNGRHWEDIVGYTANELKEHLESLFQPGMTWNNHGGWHIDHIIPKSFFRYASMDDVEFRYCWSLDNLQPLWAEDNLRKNNRIVKKYLKSD